MFSVLIRKPKPSRQGMGWRDSQKTRSEHQTLDIQHPALPNKQLNLEDTHTKKKERRMYRHRRINIAQACYARLRRKRGGDELDSSSEAGPPCRDGNVRLKRGESKGRPDQWRTGKKEKKNYTSRSLRS